MAQFTVFSATGQSTDNLWPQFGAAGVLQVLTSDFGTYWIQLTNGAYVRYSGAFSSYNSNSGVYAPSSGSYSQVDITDSNGVVLASLTGLFNESAADILNNPAATVLGGYNTFTGSVGADTLIGQYGNDQFIVRSSDLVAGDIINGGSGYADTLVLTGIGAANSSVITNVAAISSIEALQFQNGGNSAERLTFILNWNEVDSWATYINLISRGDPGSVDAVSLSAFRNTSADASLNLSNWTFGGGWGAEDLIYINGNASVADFVIGSNQNDSFNGSGGADTFNGGNGDDSFVINGGPAFTLGAAFNGDYGTDTLLIQTNSAQDLSGFNFSSVERVNLSTYNASVTFSAAQLGFNLNSAFELVGCTQFSGSPETIIFNMGLAAAFNLSGMMASNWSVVDQIIINGDADAEIITGSAYNDTIFSGGGLDTVDAGNGDDNIYMNAWGNSGPPSIGSVIGGSGFDTLYINMVPSLPYNANYVNFSYQPVAAIQSIERIEFNTDATQYFVDASFLFAQVGPGISSTLELVGADNQNDTIRFVASSAGQNLNLSGFQFTNWGSAVRIDGSAAANVITGSTIGDYVHSGGGVDTISTGNGDDVVYYDLNQVASMAVTGALNGGNNRDYLYGQFFSAGTIDFRGLSISAMEVLMAFDPFQRNIETTVIVNANQLTGTMNSLTSAGTNATVQIEMGSLYYFDGRALQFATWDAADHVIINGDADSESIAGTSQVDTINAGGGSDRIFGGAGGDTLDGGDSDDLGDTLIYIFSDAGVAVDLGANTASGGYASGDIISNFEHLTGSNFADNLIGNAGNNSIFGEYGDDLLDGGGGYDWLFGGDGDDTIIYDAADDLFHLRGGNDFDTLRVVNQAVPLTFDLVTHEFERANVITDDNTGQWWSNTSDYYNASWQRTNSDIRADDGRLVQTTYDVSPGGTGQGWQFITDYRNASNVLTNQDGKFDNGMLFSKSFDYAAGTATDGISDELREFTYFFRNDAEKAANMVANVEGFYDDGRKFTQTNDIDSNHTWLFQTNWYKTDGVTLDYQETRWDDGHTTIVPY